MPYSGRILRFRRFGSRWSMVLAFAVSGITAAGQTTYYVASNGNDANSGRSEGAPFQTLSKVNSLTLQPGDRVLFRRGDTFRGTVQVRQSGSSGNPIVLNAYGSGAKPVLAGSVLVTGWTNTGGNVWQATCAACGSRVTGLYRDGTSLPLGRYPNADAPNKGYLTVQSHSGKSSLTSQQGLPANFTGGEAVYRPLQWILNRATISGQNGNTLSLIGASGYDIADGWGFFVQNHPATLDQNGEWSYDGGSKTLRLYSDNNPNGQTLAATAFGEAVNLNGSSNVTVRDLTLTQTLSSGLFANGGSNLTISNNDVTNSGENGMYLDGAGNTLLVENNLIEDASNNGFTVQPYQNVTFRGNTVRRVGLVAGRGKSGDGTYVAVQVLSTSNTLIENNVVEQCGYIGISFTTNTTVRYNRVNDFCRVKSDGGGIYTWNGNKAGFSNMKVESNVVYGGVGTPEGTPGGAYSGANGIFLDDCSQNVELINNTSFGSHGMGIFLRGSSNITLRGNTVYNNEELQFKMGFNYTCSVRNNVTEDNVFVSRTAGQPLVAYETNGNDLGSYGSWDRNVYARPFEDLFKIRAVTNPGTGLTGVNLSLAQWQALYGKDPNSGNSPLTYKTYTLTGSGPMVLDHAFSSNTQGWDVWSNNGNGRAVWDNTNRLDGGSLQLTFASASGKSDSYLLATNPIGGVTAGKTYLLKFDAVASGSNKRVEAFLRQRTGSYRDLSARSAVLAGTGRQSFEMLFTATADEASSILVFQIPEDGKNVWIDNLKLQEVTRSEVNPDDYIRLVYNATSQPTQVSLNGTWRDARNGVRQGTIALAPFSSLVLFKEEGTVAPPPTPQPEPTVLRNPENPANAVAGLEYGYYEGTWNNLPDFNALTSAKTGTVGSPDLSVRSRDDQFGVRFRGYINVPADGTYTFYTTSDDGSKLYIGDTEVVNNDGLHGAQERSGTIGLKTGKHAVTIGFFEGGGGENLTVSYSGPNLGKQVIPASAYFRASSGGTPPPPSPSGSGTGLRAEYFNNTSLGGSAVLTRTDATVNFDWGTAAPGSGVNADNYSVRWSGQVEAPVSGSYTFSTTTDDGVRLWVNGQQLVNDWNGHAPTTNNGPAITLTAGQKYDLRMEYFEGSVGAVARLLWSYPGQGQQPIPKERLYLASGVNHVSASATSVYLSDLTWTGMTNGYGPAERDRSNGESGATDGRTLTLNGVTYAKGLGTHAASSITYDLGGQYASFRSDIGLDDETGTCGSVVFEVYLDGALAYRSSTMGTTTPTQSISLDVTGKQTLKLVVANGGDGSTCDHGDWANARLTPAGTARLAWEAAEATAIDVFPVPARDELQVRCFALHPGDASVQLLNSAAQPLKQVTQPTTAGENVIRVPVSDLNRGFYLLVLTQGDQRVTRKVLLAE